MDNYINNILEIEERNKICGEIYKITNIDNNMVYIGQTVSHRKNKLKYRPFGFIGRFKDHLSVAKNLTKKHSKCYLYNAIRSYGADKFKIELLLRCSVEELDFFEIEKIKEFNSIYPNGYNLTIGGKNSRYNNHIDYEDVLNKPNKRGGCNNRNINTRELISKRLKTHYSNIDNIIELSNQTKQQHFDKKFELFKNVQHIESTNIDKYIYLIHESKTNKDYVRVKIENSRTNFYSKHESLEEIKNRARLFIEELIKTKATLSNCSGTP